MKIKNFKAENFRNIESCSVDFSDGVNVIEGMNAQGKTNLLEAVYFMSSGRSFRRASDPDMIMKDKKYSKISIEFSDSCREKQTIEVEFFGDKLRKVYKNRVPIGRMSELIGTFRAVLFCPEHISIVRDGPAVRRGFIDSAISQLDRSYMYELQKYAKILSERNALIKNCRVPGGDRFFAETVEAWSKQLAESAAEITLKRIEYAERISEYVEKFFVEMNENVGADEKPEIFYVSSAYPPSTSLELHRSFHRSFHKRSGANDSEKIAVNNAEENAEVNVEEKAVSNAESRADTDTQITKIPENNSKNDSENDPETEKNSEKDLNAAAEKFDRKTLEKRYYELLMGAHDREIAAGSTLFGCHKDDIEIRLNGLSARNFASQGQQRSLALAIKLAEGAVSGDVSGEYPVFFLDDLLSELDCRRKAYILREVRGRQVIITTCEDISPEDTLTGKPVTEETVQEKTETEESVTEEFVTEEAVQKETPPKFKVIHAEHGEFSVRE